jgi:Zinc finger, C3HC4 type (RING finger)
MDMIAALISIYVDYRKDKKLLKFTLKSQEESQKRFNDLCRFYRNNDVHYNTYEERAATSCGWSEQQQHKSLHPTLSTYEETMCPICIERKVCVVFVACTHVCCYYCATQIIKCHICRSNITERALFRLP